TAADVKCTCTDPYGCERTTLWYDGLEVRMSLGERLKELRVRNRKSLQELADEIGASKAHIWELETGRAKNPSIELLSLLAKALRASVADLIGENPDGAGEPADAVRMYRELKELTPEDRQMIQTMMDHFKKRKE